MNEEQQLLAALQANIPGSTVRCKVVSGMWIVEIILANLGQANKQLTIDAVNRSVARAVPTNPIIWKLFLYQNVQERFVVDGTLHTIEQTYTSEGFPSTTLSGLDSFLDITAFDAEVLQLGLQEGVSIIAKNSIGDNGQPILPYHERTDYLWLETLGGHYGVIQNGTRLLQNGNIEITLGSR